MWEAIVVGSGQDAGVPQVGCSCPRCSAARLDSAFRRLGPSLLLRNVDSGQAVLIDPSPDIREQLDRYLPPLGLEALKSIYVTHGHVGHYWGLALLGKEGPDLKDIVVHGTEDTLDMLARTPAIGLMLSRGNIRMQTLTPGHSQGDASLSIEPVPVPHRAELTGTVGFRIKQNSKTLLYIPDVDRWTPEVVSEVLAADLAVVDGTFYSADELGKTRPIAEIPHPPMLDTMSTFGEVGGAANGRVFFTHLNHTNPAGSPGPEQDHVLQANFGIAHDGMVLWEDAVQPLSP